MPSVRIFRRACTFFQAALILTDVKLEIATRAEGSATVMDLGGRVTLEDAPEFLEALMSLLKAKKPPRVLVNMSQVSYIDSAGVACLVEAFKVARDSKIGFALFGLRPIARDVFELTKLISVFELYETEQEALRGKSGTPSSS
ncbi:MAG: STAS domain-containing protein [Acidobacteriota bacterium]|nr:STAS domain-containing protein [Acidobacteriota bacterium]